MHEIVVWSATGRVIYAPDHTRIGRRTPLTNALGAALDGQTVTRVLDGGDVPGQHGVRRVVVSVPLLRGDGQRPVGAIEMRLPYEPSAAAIRKQSVRILVFLGDAALL